MKRLLFSFTLVGFLVIQSTAFPVTAEAGNSFRRKVAATCSALFATATVGLSAGYALTGKLPSPGFGSRIYMYSDRRAIVAFLARALGLKEAPADQKKIEIVREEEMALPEDFIKMPYEQFANSTYVLEARGDGASGYILLFNELAYFQLKYAGDGSLHYWITSSPL